MERKSAESLLLGIAGVCVICLRFQPSPVQLAESADDASPLICEWHASCFMGTAFLLTLVYFDDRPVSISQGGRTVKLLGSRRWYLLGTQAYTALFGYFTVSMMIDMGIGATSSRFRRLAGLLFAVAWPASLLATGFARLALRAFSSSQSNTKWSQLGLGGRPRPLFLYNSNVLFCLGELTLGHHGKLCCWQDLPFAVLFAALFCASQLQLFKDHKIYPLSLLDLQMPRAWLRYLLFFFIFVVLYCTGPLVIWIYEIAPFGTLWTHVSMMVVAIAFVPLWDRKQQEEAASVISKLD